jgi:hypothetical protein
MKYNPQNIGSQKTGLGNSVRMTEKEKRFRGFFVCNTGV